jgi:hypothetical protein
MNFYPLDAQRPEYVYISGSYALKEIQEHTNGVSSIKGGDIDIYINIEHENFNMRECCKFYNVLISSDFYCHRMRHFTGVNFISSMMNEFIISINTLKRNKIVSEFINEFIGEDNDNATENIDDYMNGDGFSVIKLKNKENDQQIDIIFILTSMEEYMDKLFDISIVKNYINNNGEIISLYKDHVDKNIAEYKYSLFKSRLSISTHISKFIDRIFKYNDRNVKIYMTFSDFKDNNSECYSCTELKDITCECGIRLSKENIKNVMTGVVNNILTNYKIESSFKHSTYKFSIDDDGIFIFKNIKKPKRADILRKFSNILKPSYVNVLLLSDLTNVAILRLRIIMELKKVLSSPKFVELEADHWD